MLVIYLPHTCIVDSKEYSPKEIECVIKDSLSVGRVDLGQLCVVGLLGWPQMGGT